MKRFINFGSIEQFRNIVKKISTIVRYAGKDNEGNIIFDDSKELPIVELICSEKIHGTNASVCYSNIDGFWTQSKKNIITPEKDNAGFAFHAYQKKEVWIKLIKQLSEEHNIDLNKNIISIYSEWCGGKIQKKSAVSTLEKRAIIFQYFKVSPINPIDEDSKNEKEKKTGKWIVTQVDNKWISSDKDGIYNIMNFPYYTYTLDFNRPDIIQKKLINLVTNVIEPNSPAGRQYGIEGNTGEGVVCTFVYDGTVFRFKVKGEKHTSSKVKTLGPIDSVEVKKKIDFANAVCTPSRLEQAWQSIFGVENEKMDPTIKEIGNFLRAVFQDVLKEESDIMSSKGLEPKDVGKYISEISKEWFLEELNKTTGI